MTLYKSHDKQEIGHEWVIQTLEEWNASLTANFQVQNIIVNTQNPCYNKIIVTGILWWCHWYNYCTSDIATLVPQREKLMLHLRWPTCHQRFFPFFYFAGHQGQWWAGMFFKDLPLRVVEKIFCIFPGTCMFDWIALDLFPLHRLKGASKLFMTIKTDWWITSGTRKNDVACMGSYELKCAWMCQLLSHSPPELPLTACTDLLPTSLLSHVGSSVLTIKNVTL